MRWAAPVAVAALLLLAPPAIGSFHENTGNIPDRVFTLVMQGTTFNGLSAPLAPLLETYVGERARFMVASTEPHTFHLHGHPWVLADRSVVDTFLIQPDTPHGFDIIAGGSDKHAGDWMYHCHIDDHMAQGMWGIMRVYPFLTRIDKVGHTVEVTLERLGEPVEGATFSVRVDEVELPAHVAPLGEGHYHVHAAFPASGALVVTATHPTLGESVARLAYGGASAPVVTLEHAHVA